MHRFKSCLRMRYHPLLQDQIARHLGSSHFIDGAMDALFTEISEQYTNLNTEIKRLEKWSESGAETLIETNQELRNEKLNQSLAIHNIKESLGVIDANTLDPDYFGNDLLSLSSLLGEQIAMKNLALELLREREEGLRLIIEGAKEFAIYTLDASGFVISWNSGAERLMGFPTSEIIGKHFSMFFGDPGNNQQLSDRALSDAATEGQFEYEGWFISKSGSTFWGDMTLSQLRDDQGMLKGYVSITRDITDRNRASEELRKAKEDAEAATKAKSEFLANMSHEIRTPMNAVIGMTSLLIGTKLDEEQQEYVTTIESSGEVLLSLINNILDFSKLEAKKVSVDLHPFNLITFLEKCCDLVANAAYDANLELILEIQNELPEWIVSDSARLRQIIINLLSNAIKFTHQGEIVFSAGLAEDALNGKVLRLKIEDTGIGIESEKIESLFSPFSQADISTTKKYGGTGLGLSISMELAKLLQGDITVESEPGKGSTFSLTLPLQQANQHARESTHVPFNQEHVLVVDDNARSRKNMESILASWNLEVNLAASGSETLRWVSKENSFDVILIDMEMTGMDGITLASLVKKRNPHAAIIILNSFGKRINHPSVDDSIPKPVKRNVLYQKLEGILGRKELENLSDAFPRQPESLNTFLNDIKILIIEDNPVEQRRLIEKLEKQGFTPDLAASVDEIEEMLMQRVYDVIFLDGDMLKLNRNLCQYLHAHSDQYQQSFVVAMLDHAPEQYPDYLMNARVDECLVKPVSEQDLTGKLSAIQKKRSS